MSLVKELLHPNVPENLTVNEEGIFKRTYNKMLGSLAIEFTGIGLIVAGIASEDEHIAFGGFGLFVASAVYGARKANQLEDMDILSKSRPQADALPLESSPDN